MNFIGFGARVDYAPEIMNKANDKQRLQYAVAPTLKAFPETVEDGIVIRFNHVPPGKTGSSTAPAVPHYSVTITENGQPKHTSNPFEADRLPIPSQIGDVARYIYQRVARLKGEGEDAIQAALPQVEKEATAPLTRPRV